MTTNTDLYVLIRPDECTVRQDRKSSLNSEAGKQDKLCHHPGQEIAMDWE